MYVCVMSVYQLATKIFPSSVAEFPFSTTKTHTCPRPSTSHNLSYAMTILNFLCHATRKD